MATLAHRSKSTDGSEKRLLDNVTLKMESPQSSSSSRPFRTTTDELSSIVKSNITVDDAFRKEFLEILQEEDLFVLETFVKNLPVEQLPIIAAVVTYLFSLSKKPLLPFHHFTKLEISSISGDTILRSDSFASALISQLCMIHGKPFINSVVTNHLREMYTASSFEIDSRREEIEDIEYNGDLLIAMTSALLHDIFHSVDSFPPILREAFHFIKNMMNEKGLSHSNSRKIMASLVFLKFIVPTASDPRKHGILTQKEKFSPKGNRNCVLAAKLMQVVANNSHFKVEDHPKIQEKFDNFVSSQQEDLTAFIEAVSTSSVFMSPRAIDIPPWDCTLLLAYYMKIYFEKSSAQQTSAVSMLPSPKRVDSLGGESSGSIAGVSSNHSTGNTSTTLSTDTASTTPGTIEPSEDVGDIEEKDVVISEEEGRSDEDAENLRKLQLNKLNLSSINNVETAASAVTTRPKQAIVNRLKLLLMKFPDDWTPNTEENSENSESSDFGDPTELKRKHMKKKLSLRDVKSSLGVFKLTSSTEDAASHKHKRLSVTVSSSSSHVLLGMNTDKIKELRNQRTAEMISGNLSPRMMDLAPQPGPDSSGQEEKEKESDEEDGEGKLKEPRKKDKANRRLATRKKSGEEPKKRITAAHSHTEPPSADIAARRSSLSKSSRSNKSLSNFGLNSKNKTPVKEDSRVLQSVVQENLAMRAKLGSLEETHNILRDLQEKLNKERREASELRARVAVLEIANEKLRNLLKEHNISAPWLDNTQ